MRLRIKNWSKHQHFKDRTPPWIKLYREILDDPDWHELDGDSAKVLISLWLIASEDDSHLGLLPDARRLAFRLRIKESQLNQYLTKLKHWLIQDDIKQISDGYQLDAPERAGEETETETETETDGFDIFWSIYPNKKARPAAARAFKAAKINGILPDVLADIESRIDSTDWQKEHGKFIPHPATYLNQRRWEDGKTQNSGLGAFL
jgi:hypothetical protein